MTGIDDSLKRVLHSLGNFADEQMEEIVACFKPKTVKRNEILLAEGDICKSFYYVHNGCIRTYFINTEGHEKTRYVMPDYHIGTALASFISQKPSFEFIDALEDTEMLVITHYDFYRLNTEMVQWKDFYQKILEMAYSFQNKKIESRITLSAKQRYEQLLQENPLLVQRLSNKILASYIDVTQETLSRLKSK